MATKHSGSCHCGAVRFEAETDLGSVLTCNCSHCSRKGLLLTFVPSAQFTLLAGEDDLSEYLFNKHVIHHLSCRTCSVQPFARGKGPDGSDMVAVNVRCLEGIELSELNPTPVDGRSF